MPETAGSRHRRTEAPQVQGCHAPANIRSSGFLHRDNRLKPNHEGTHGIRGAGLLDRKVVTDEPVIPAARKIVDKIVELTVRELRRLPRGRRTKRADAAFSVRQPCGEGRLRLAGRLVCGHSEAFLTANTGGALAGVSHVMGNCLPGEPVTVPGSSQASARDSRLQRPL
ncbi:MAG: hypothetical protein DCC69_10995 [Hyphomicrobiales bacterium]|nr:MAG: hypothetical protein DCC69_10995 [Hyphomicrobiales bacterium]